VFLAGSQLDDLRPLAKLEKLRYINLRECGISDVRPLLEIPLLHEVDLADNPIEAEQLAEFQGALTSWDTEFLAREYRYQPSFALRVISEEEFDSVHPYNWVEGDGDHDILGSEREWLVSRIRASLESRFKDEEDFEMPGLLDLMRSHGVYLPSV